MRRRNLLASLALLPFGLRLRGNPCEVRGSKPKTQDYVAYPEGLKTVFVLGDFGTGGGFQKKVAQGMNARAAAHGKPLAMISTGDNIYPSGVESVEDKQWLTKFEQIYHQEFISEQRWYAVLGNHDYRGNVLAQIEYSKVSARWVMPHNYYASACPQAETLMTFVCLDTQMILQKMNGWKDQLLWLKKTLAAVQTPWKIVVGHHPIRSYGHYGDQPWMLEHVKPLLDESQVDLYLCGHDHDLQIIKDPSDAFVCMVSGAGGGCRSTAWGANSKRVVGGTGFGIVYFDQYHLYAELANAEGEGTGMVPIASRERN